MRYSKCIRMIRHTPAVDWQTAVRRMDSEERMATVKTLDGIIEGATRLRGYIDRQAHLGLQSMEHEQSVKAANALVKKVRKALGYTFPDGSSFGF